MSDYFIKMSLSGGSGGGSGADTTLRGKYVRSTRFVSIGAGTSGSVTLPSNATVVLDDFGGTVDAVVLKISGGKPQAESAKDGGGAIIAATFDGSGNYVLSGTPSAYPVALVYRVTQTAENFDSTSSDIWGPIQVDLSGKEDTANKSTDVDADKTSDVKYSTPKSIFTYIGSTYASIGNKDLVSNSVNITASGAGYFSFDPTGSSTNARARFIAVNTTNRDYTLPNASGTIALTSDIPSINTVLSSDLDFGTGNDLVTATVAAAWVTSSSYLSPSIVPNTSDHNFEDVLLEQLHVTISNIIDNVSFDVTIHAPNGTTGKYKVQTIGV